MVLLHLICKYAACKYKSFKIRAGPRPHARPVRRSVPENHKNACLHSGYGLRSRQRLAISMSVTAMRLCLIIYLTVTETMHRAIQGV